MPLWLERSWMHLDANLRDEVGATKTVHETEVRGSLDPGGEIGRNVRPPRRRCPAQQCPRAALGRMALQQYEVKSALLRSGHGDAVAIAAADLEGARQGNRSHAVV